MLSSMALSACLFVIGVVLSVGQATKAQAIEICNCCSLEQFGGTANQSKKLSKSCMRVCAQANQAENNAQFMCRAAVAFDSRSRHNSKMMRTGHLENVYLAAESRKNLESYRIMMERERRKIERTFRKSKWAWERRRISHSAFKKAEAKRNEAMVNYYHGMQSYIAVLRQAVKDGIFVAATYKKPKRYKRRYVRKSRKPKKEYFFARLFKFFNLNALSAKN